MPPSPALFAVTAFISVAILLGAGKAGAAAAGRQVEISLTYQSPSGCPSRDAIVEQLENRGLRVVADTSKTRLTIDVAVDPPDARRFKGQLTVEADNPKGPTLSRAVKGQDCGAVTLSLALVAGLALNPTSDGVSDAPPDADTAVVQPAGRDADQRPAWFVGVTGRAMTALGVGPALGLSAFVEHAWRGTPGSPVSLAFSVATVAPGAVTLALGSADLRAYFGRLDGCWFGAGLATARVVLSPCVGMEGGLLQARGNIARPRTATRPWAAPVISARGAVRLTRRVSLSFAGHAFSPLVRDTFVFNDPDATIYRTPVLGGGLEIGLAGVF